MIKKTINYTDYNGNHRKMDAYFNLTKAELVRMQAGTSGGLDEKLQQISDAKNGNAAIDVIEDVIKRSYGIKTDDGGFVKKQEYLEAFMATEAYSELFMQLLTDDVAAAEFIKGVIPADLAKQAAELIDKQ